MSLNIIIILVGIFFSAMMVAVAYKINGTTQPKQLWMLFFTEMWERFSFYGMRALLILYMTNVLFMPDDKANYQYGAYNALVYTMPLLGGWLADRLLGYRKSIVLGGVLMAIGHLVLALPNQWTFFLGLGFLITGNGFFKPNISSFLGTYYTEDDPRKDTGYSIFYMGVNIGAFLGSMICGYLGKSIDWHLGFGVAGVFMILGLIVFLFNQKILEDKGYSPLPQVLSAKRSGLSNEKWLYLGAFALVPISMLLVKAYQVTTYLMVPLGLVSLGYIIFVSLKLDKKEKEKLWAAILLIVSSLAFWGFYEQSGGSLNLMAERNVDFKVGGTILESAMMNNSVNPFYIIFLTPLLGVFWNYIERKKINFSIPFKFSLSFALVGVGYSIFYLGGQNGISNGSGLMPLAFFMFAYFFITMGELFISPIGLSMITKLSPLNMFGFMMGLWFLSSALGHKLAAWIGGKMAIPQSITESTHYNPLESLPIYMNGCKQIAIASVASCILLFLLSRITQKWMHGVK